LQKSDFTPKTSRDFIGMPQVYADLRKTIKNNSKALLYGPPGVGKTSSVHVIASELNYTVIETNASDTRKRQQLRKILTRCQQTGLFGKKILFLLDEVDGLHAWKTLENILKKSLHSVILTANDGWRIPDRIKHYCTVIKYPQPFLKDVVHHLRKINKDKDADFSGVSRDVRASINSVLYGGEKYKTKDIFQTIGDYFKTRDTSDLKPFHISWLIDNAHHYYTGRDLYDFIVLLELSTRTSLRILKHAPEAKGKKVRYPYYLRRLKILRSKDKPKIPPRDNNELI
jgi:replication-associated recombination protein RarA